MPKTALPLALSALLAGTLAGYNPPVDTAGPVTARIQEPSIGLYGAGGPTALTRAGMAFSLTVTLENSAGEPVSGKVRLNVIDSWRAEPGSQPFALGPRGRARVEFTVTVGEGSYNAHYPIHAFVEFAHQGRAYVAHPIMILVTRLPDPPRARLPVEWKPVEAPASGMMGLWRLPVRREVIRVLSGQAAPGRSGQEAFEMSAPVRYGASVARGAARESVAMRLGPRPPSREERIGAAAVEYPIALPASKPIRLKFGAAVDDRAGPVNFRVRVAGFDAPEGQAGTLVLDKAIAAKRWQDLEADLTRFAGRNVRVQLEAEAAAPETVEAYWAEPALQIGTPAEPAAFPPPQGAQSRLLGTVALEGDRYEVRLWPGRRGLLDATTGFVNGNRRLLFHGFHVRVLGDSLEDLRSASDLLRVETANEGGRSRFRHQFRSWAGSFDLMAEIWCEGAALRARFWLENEPKPQPWLATYLEEITAGPWSDQAERVYAGVGNVIYKPQAFQLGFDGHRLATSFVGFEFPGGMAVVQGVDVPPERLDVDPETRTYSLNTPHAQTMTFIPSRDAWKSAKAWRDFCGMHASAGVGKLAGRFVFDLWGFAGNYADSAKALEKAFRYGLTDAAVIWHSWQRWGYDYRLPDIYPPNPQGGTLEDFVTLARACDKAGVLFAPHDNYIDFYPDSDGFTYENIVFNPDGQPRRAWYNSGRQAQSYRVRSDRLRPYLERNVRLIKDGISPSAYFIDVWSSMGPYDYWSYDGQFFDRLVTRKVWRESFAWIRDYLGNKAPQISEAGHDQLIGWLDGAQANHLRVENPPARGFLWTIGNQDAERVPWFDMAYHDTFALHGAGYQDRYAAGLDLRGHGMYSDDYIATEVLTGHPAMVPAPFGREVVRKYWLLHDVMRALAGRRIDAVEFADGNLHRQRVRWEGGGEVVVNRGPEDWRAGEHVLPEHGYYARVPVKGGVVETGIERRDGLIVEWSNSPEFVYANARPVVLERIPRWDADDRGPDPRPARMNPEGKPVRFGAATTNGGFRLEREGGAVRLVPLPASPAFSARLRWGSLPWGTAAPRGAEALDEAGNVIRQVELRSEGGEVALECEVGVFAYRLR